MLLRLAPRASGPPDPHRPPLFRTAPRAPHTGPGACSLLPPSDRPAPSRPAWGKWCGRVTPDPACRSPYPLRNHLTRRPYAGRSISRELAPSRPTPYTPRDWPTGPQLHIPIGWIPRIPRSCRRAWPADGVPRLRPPRGQTVGGATAAPAGGASSGAIACARQNR